MPKKIIEIIKKLQEDDAADPSHTKLNDIQQQAFRVIEEAVKLPSWDTFAKNFIDGNNNAEQLARLKLEDDLSKEDPYMKRAVAYLFANTICGGSSGTDMHVNVGGILDVGITRADTEDNA